MAPSDSLTLYKKYYVDRDFERLDLFQQLSEDYGVQSA